MTVARFRSVVIDCPDPLALAQFYAAIVGGTPSVGEVDWVVLETPGVPRLAFQRAAGFTPPEWPRADRNSQQFHIDLDAGSTWEEIDAAERKVLALGARLLHAEDKEDFRVYADPAGHPFCLCRIEHA
ncbi:VOC family protein [Streptomyces sp. WM6386]|uniref:VOC family protein n=1 Tax=Streptomyces sp. WM6386 TaxID=1415558 RepID=UPI000619A8F8|nr:VOC family protein [Streptomyces sp. WM6386]KKD08577.1 glyoxalase [Streptomyces sp. WM6386]